MALPGSPCIAVDNEEHCIWRAQAHERGQRRRGSAGALQIQCSSFYPAIHPGRFAASILNHAARSTEIEGIEVRLTELESAAEVQKNNQKVGVAETKRVSYVDSAQ